MTTLFTISSATFVKESGNLSAYTVDTRERVHIYAAMAAAAGWLKAEDIKYPFLVMAEPVTYNERDENDENVLDADGAEVTFTRLTGRAIFKDTADYAAAANMTELAIARKNGDLQATIFDGSKALALNKARFERQIADIMSGKVVHTELSLQNSAA